MARNEYDYSYIGGITFKGPPNQAGEVEIGYGIAEASRNNGYMTECLQALVRWALHQDGVTAVIAETAKENLPSEAVLRHNGFEHVRDTEELDIGAFKPLPTESILTALIHGMAIVEDNIILVPGDCHAIDATPIDVLQHYSLGLTGTLPALLK